MGNQNSKVIVNRNLLYKNIKYIIDYLEIKNITVTNKPTWVCGTQALGPDISIVKNISIENNHCIQDRYWLGIDGHASEEVSRSLLWIFCKLCK